MRAFLDISPSLELKKKPNDTLVRSSMSGRQYHVGILDSIHFDKLLSEARGELSNL